MAERGSMYTMDDAWQEGRCTLLLCHDTVQLCCERLAGTGAGERIIHGFAATTTGAGQPARHPSPMPSAFTPTFRWEWPKSQRRKAVPGPGDCFGLRAVRAGGTSSGEARDVPSARGQESVAHNIHVQGSKCEKQVHCSWRAQLAPPSGFFSGYI